MEQATAEPVIRLRFLAQILDAQPVDLDANNAIQNITKHGETTPGYKVAFVTVLPEGDTGSLIALAKGHRILLETVPDE